MNILAVDDESLALETLSRTIKNVAPTAELLCFDNSMDALKGAEGFEPDVAFLDIEMPGMNGLELARHLKDRVNPFINIIFTTGYNEFIETAFMELRSSGYLMKPITEKKVKTELENLRVPVDEKKDSKLRIKTFGNFEVFVRGKSIRFHYSKTRELLAYLVHSHCMCSNAQLQEALWQESDEITDHGSYLQNIISDLRNTMKEYGVEDALVKRYGQIGVNDEVMDCDYYDYLAGSPEARKAFKGEYMTQYSWGEERLAGMISEMY